MSVLIGILFALSGGLAILTGLTGMRRVQRLRNRGVSVWAMAVPEPASAGDQPDEPRRTLIQYTLADGRVIEQLSPGSGRKARSLRPGDKVLVWYDPEDPQDVLVYGREGTFSDRAFVTTGLVIALIGLWLTGFFR